MKNIRICQLACLLIIQFLSYGQPFIRDIEEFAIKDSIEKPSQGGILFIGSSSFTMWTNIKEDLNNKTIINRAFGGSTLHDLLFYKEKILLPYSPKQVVIYCGENDFDTDSTMTPTKVTQRLKSLVFYIRDTFPQAKITYVSMKPSPKRKHLLKKFKKANNQIEGFIKSLPNANFIDIYGDMLQSSGEPRKDIFLQDMLHMNEKGYEIWIKKIKKHLI